MYSFVNFSGTIEPMFLGINLSESNLVFAFIVAAAQFYQLKTTQVKQPKKSKEDMDQTEKMQDMMQKQMLFLFPIFTLFILAYLPSALGLYWLVITIFSIIQQKIILKN